MMLLILGHASSSFQIPLKPTLLVSESHHLSLCNETIKALCTTLDLFLFTSLGARTVTTSFAFKLKG